MKRDAFIVWLGIFLIWTAYRAIFPSVEFIDEVIVKPLIFIVPIILIVLMYERKPLTSLGVPDSLKHFMLDVYLGVGVGIVFAVEGLMVNFVKYGTYEFGPLEAVGVAGGVLPFLFINLVTAICEEVFARGYLFTRLYEVMDEWAAILVSSFLFMLLHVPIFLTQLHLSGPALFIYPLSIMLLSIMNCYIFMERKSLVLPILLHLFWNMTVALYL